MLKKLLWLFPILNLILLILSWPLSHISYEKPHFFTYENLSPPIIGSTEGLIVLPQTEDTVPAPAAAINGRIPIPTAAQHVSLPPTPTKKPLKLPNEKPHFFTYGNLSPSIIGSTEELIVLPQTEDTVPAPAVAINDSIPISTAAQHASLPPIPTKKPLKLPNIPTESVLDSYSVTVAANEQLTIPGPPGELRVWIGISSKAPRVQPKMVTETKELEAVGETAKIKPFALGIDVDSKESICSKIDPTGTEVRFKLTPKEGGIFTVGADVELYNSNNCSGTPVPKSAKSVTVNVTIDNNKILEKSTSELISTAWKTFLDFWEKLILLAFALLLFFIRKKLSKLFGFEFQEKK